MHLSELGGGEVQRGRWGGLLVGQVVQMAPIVLEVTVESDTGVALERGMVAHYPSEGHILSYVGGSACQTRRSGALAGWCAPLGPSGTPRATADSGAVALQSAAEPDSPSTSVSTRGG